MFLPVLELLLSDYSTILDIIGNSVLLGLLSFFVFPACKPRVLIVHKFFSMAQKKERKVERRVVFFWVILDMDLAVSFE